MKRCNRRNTISWTTPHGSQSNGSDSEAARVCIRWCLTPLLARQFTSCKALRFACPYQAAHHTNRQLPLDWDDGRAHLGSSPLSTNSVIPRSLNFPLVTFGGFAKRFWWELVCPVSDGIQYLPYHGGLVPRPVGERHEIIASRLGVQEVIATTALVLASRCFYCPGRC